MIGPEQAPTRAAVLELKDERGVVSEAYDFLDEKRLLLAAELFDNLQRYERLLEQVEASTRQAGEALRATVEVHGLQGTGVYPAVPLAAFELEISQRRFMGVELIATRASDAAPATMPERSPSRPSAEAEACRAAFRELLAGSAELAGLSVNLHRLMAEYRVTERRARALENVILPEIEQTLSGMSAHLEELELEDAVRARLPVI